MTTQLRLVDPPPPIQQAPADKPQARRGAVTATTEKSTHTKPIAGRARVARRSKSASSAGRRAARWGEWQLDAHTRSVGRAGIAAARAALQQVSNADSFPKAS